ncbi:hypothetical protein [Streptomyces sp. NPDC005017]|uniref:hypothetical protein n=1 Tax=Streptomyces sp. NPDC005017 TaxID=3364706 RepID=UPI00367FC906
MSRPAVLAVTLPGATALRLEVESEVRRRGWPSAGTPAAADLLVVCGVPGPEDSRWLDGVEQSMPEPAVRVAVTESGGSAHALGRARRELSDRVVTGRDDRAVHTAPPGHGDGHAHPEPSGHDTHGPHGSQGTDDTHGTHDVHGTHDMHGTHDAQRPHDMHAMGEIAGLPMAGRAQDRDALTLDQLHLPLGPALPDWPAGLILRLTLQGDVAQAVEVDHVPLPPGGDRLPFWDEPWLRAARGDEVTRDAAARRRCAAHLDSAGRLLAVAGWADAAARCRRLRDELLSGASRERAGGELDRTLHRVRRSRPLRWSLAGLGHLPAGRARAAGVSGPALAANGDAHDRLLRWLSEIEAALEGLDDAQPLPPDDRTGPRGRLDGPRLPSAALLDVLPGLLTGSEFACARIILASLDPDLDELALAPLTEGAHA